MNSHIATYLYELRQAEEEKTLRLQKLAKDVEE
jgi:hypothetical protein